MTHNTFIASEIRLEWAGEKLDQLESLIQRAINDALESDGDRMKVLGDFIFAVQRHAQRLISEYALHARAALDYIVFDLALHNTKAEQEKTAFPLKSNPKKFPWKLDDVSGLFKGVGPLEHLEPEQVALVERFQPYRLLPLLHVLRELSNRDKHRHFVHISATRLTGPILPSKAKPASRIEIALSGDDAIKSLRALHGQLSDILAAFNKLLEPLDAKTP